MNKRILHLELDKEGNVIPAMIDAADIEIRVASGPSTEHPVLSTYYGDGDKSHILYVDVDIDIAVRYNQLDDLEEQVNIIKANIALMRDEYCTNLSNIDPTEAAADEIQAIIDDSRSK
jgi:hypothetical protein